jgi:hypothetical protein
MMGNFQRICWGLVILGILMAGIVYTSGLSNDCETRGGVLVQSPVRGFVCVEPK